MLLVLCIGALGALTHEARPNGATPAGSSDKEAIPAQKGR
jgi:hypothetical protein